MMKKGYGIKGTSDVIVYLIPISTTVESGDTGRKRKRDAESTEGLLATFNLHSERLCHCSKYFQILLDKRWSDSNRKSPMEFFLEVHTDVKYYGDCFSRMYAPNFTGIPSVKHALELLKVASQIEFAELMDEALCYLSLVPWLEVEETNIRKFPFSKYISAGGLSDLKERLRLHESKEESYQRLYEVGQNYLSSSLEYALESVGGDNQIISEMFAAAFYDIVQPGSCYNLAKDAYALVTERAQEVLWKTATDVENSNCLESNFNMICWIFELLLNAKGAKELVQHMVRDRFFCDSVSENCSGQGGFIRFEWPLKWTTTLLSIFDEVLAGRLLLKSSERVSLFSDWEWLISDGLSGEYLPKAAPLTVSSFMMTLPHEHQTTKLKQWLCEVDDSSTCVPWNVLEVAHPLWIKALKRSLVALDSARMEVMSKNPDEPGSSSPATSRCIERII